MYRESDRGVLGWVFIKVHPDYKLVEKSQFITLKENAGVMLRVLNSVPKTENKPSVSLDACKIHNLIVMCSLY